MPSKDILKETIKKHKKETKETQQLISRLKEARKRGYLKRDEFLAICKWKSPRPIKHYKKNREYNIIKTTKKVFKMKYEKRKILLLDKLTGVNIPVASAILALVYPEKYGVIDIRAWNALIKLRKIKRRGKARKRYFNEKDWYHYLMIIRHLAKQYRVTPRNIDRALYFYDVETQKEKSIYR